MSLPGTLGPRPAEAVPLEPAPDFVAGLAREKQLQAVPLDVLDEPDAADFLLGGFPAGLYPGARHPLLPPEDVRPEVREHVVAPLPPRLECGLELVPPGLERGEFL